jgi:glycosyltransferase involved in cell wall biosynthesis
MNDDPTRQATLLICTPTHILRGGVERIIERLATQLPAHGFRVVLGLGRGLIFNSAERYRLEYPGLEYVDVDGRSGTRLGRVRGLRRAIEQIRPDIVLIARLFDAYEAVVERKHRGEPLRLAVTIQSYEPEYVTDLDTYADWVDLCVTSGRMIANAVDRFTAVPAERVHSIPGGVLPAHTAVRHDDARPLRLGYVGRLEHAQKRILDLVEMLRGLVESGTHFTCQIVGSGPAEEELRRLTAAHGLDELVVFQGWRGTEELYRDVYPNLDVFLHFAAWEGVTISPREAMAHGVVPVVSRFVGCLAEGQFLEGHNALTFDVGDLRGAVACVRRLDSDRALLRRLSAGASRSQGGINSDSGALAAWAAGFRQALENPPRRGERPPKLRWPPSGRLERWGLPPELSETLRRWCGRVCKHRSPGNEWPHRSGLADAARMREIMDFAARFESELSAGRRPSTSALGSVP